jgi:hypothetical protein
MSTANCSFNGTPNILRNQNNNEDKILLLLLLLLLLLMLFPASSQNLHHQTLMLNCNKITKMSKNL